MNNVGSRVLVVDDEDAICEMLDYGMRQAGFDVRTVSDGLQLLQAIPAWQPEIIILDVMLPEADGFTLLPAVRRLTDAPVIMLSALTDTAQKVAGLSSGADDYVGKPFELEELVARINSALRRPRIELREQYRYADVLIDLSRRSVFRGERRINLSPREFDLLLTFVRNPERVFTRGKLLDLVWGIDKDIGPNTVETYISYLRAKVDSNERVKLIHTERGVGYSMRAVEA